MTTVLTITCATCGALERFEGDLRDAIAQAQASGRWGHSDQGFAVCHVCGCMPAAERLERGPLPKRDKNVTL